MLSSNDFGITDEMDRRRVVLLAGSGGWVSCSNELDGTDSTGITETLTGSGRCSTEVDEIMKAVSEGKDVSLPCFKGQLSCISEEGEVFADKLILFPVVVAALTIL